MGIGDDIIATGMARGAALRGKRIAFGDGHRIIWGPHSQMVFAGNPNIAAPGSERSGNIEWVKYYKGHRIYNSDGGAGRWIWNYKFKVKPGEFYLTPEETRAAPGNLVLIEPNVPNKPCAPNKQWPVERFRKVADVLKEMGFSVAQFDYGGPNRVAPGIPTKTFRQAVGLLKNCLFAILPEGGLHHAAAAVGAPAVVLFGGFVPPDVLGYESHVNLTGGATACGSFRECRHCRDAMLSISVDEVMASINRTFKC